MEPRTKAPIIKDLPKGYDEILRLADRITLSKMELIHYGANKYDPKKFRKVENMNFVKPKGGLWTSPVDSEFGWKDWCVAEDFRSCNKENSFKVRFKDDAKVAIIDTYEDMDKLPLQDDRFHSILMPNFESLAIDIDAIWMTAEGQWATRMSHPKSLYGWDCESVLIMNPDCIEPIERY